jgi:hypothetical protein
MSEIYNSRTAIRAMSLSMKHAVFLIGVAVTGVLCASLDAQAAIGLPDTESCNNGGACLTLTNTSTLFGSGAIQGTGINGVSGNTSSSAGVGVVGSALGTGRGVLGTSHDSYGVVGDSISSVGVYGNSAQSDGVMGQTAGSGASGVYGENNGHGIGIAGRITPVGTGMAVYGDNNSTSGFAGYFRGNLQVTRTPFCSGCTVFTNNSDIRLKKNVTPLTGALERLLQLRGVNFEWIDPEEHGNHRGAQRGFIAQEVEKVIPEWVGVDSKGFKTLNTSGMEPMVVESLRALKKENDDLRERVKALEARRSPVLGAMTGDGAFGIAGFFALGAALVLSRRRGRGVLDKNP